MKNVNINVNVRIPEGILLALRENDQDFASDMKRWTALKLYENNKLSIGHSAELSGMAEEEFIKFLAKNKISIF